MHGGVGFTWEYDCHLFYRRARSLAPRSARRPSGARSWSRDSRRAASRAPAAARELAPTSRVKERMDFDDTPQEAEFRAKARAWLAKHLEPAEPRRGGADELGEREDGDAIARAKRWQAKKFDAGWAVLTWPKEFGGQGLARLEAVIWGQEEARFKTPPPIYGIGHGMLGPTLMAHGTPEQKERYVKEMARGQVVWCQLFSEPAAGSDLAGLRTTAVRDGDDWMINGQKIWSTGAQYCDWGMIVTRTDPSARSTPASPTSSST